MHGRPILTARNSAFQVQGVTPVVTVELLADGRVVDDVRMHGLPTGEWSPDPSDLARLEMDVDFRALGLEAGEAIALLAREAESGNGFEHLPIRNEPDPR